LHFAFWHFGSQASSVSSAGLQNARHLLHCVQSLQLLQEHFVNHGKLAEFPPSLHDGLQWSLHFWQPLQDFCQEHLVDQEFSFFAHQLAHGKLSVSALSRVVVVIVVVKMVVVMVVVVVVVVHCVQSLQLLQVHFVDHGRSMMFCSHDGLQ